MPDINNASQSEIIRALIRAGGTETKGMGKGSHRTVKMPGRRPVTIPRRLNPGLIRTIIRQAGLTVDEFREVSSMPDMQAYTILIHEDEDLYWAEVEELPGCFVSGLTLDELDSDVRAAIEQHVAALKELGEDVPQGKHLPEATPRRWEIGVAI